MHTDVVRGTQLAENPLQGAVTANSSTPTALASSYTPILWVIVQNLGTVKIFVGGSTVANSGDLQGIQATPTGATPLLPFRDLSRIFVIAESGSPRVTFIAGLAPVRTSGDP